jgi:hypothetical protein
VLLLHELHRVAGAREDEFEEAFKDGWLPALAKADDARLLWYFKQAHGSGPSYTVVTITAVSDYPAFDHLMKSVLHGELRAWAREVDALRHHQTSKLLEPLEWSKLSSIDFSELEPAETERDQALYMEDTVSPFPGKFDEYVTKAGDLYARQTVAARERSGNSLLTIEAAFRSVVGAREVILLQRVVRPELLVPLLTREVPAEHRAPGTWMHDALELRDRWESRLLRTVPWSPLPR